MDVRLAQRLRDDPPDLVVHSGDIVYEDPDSDEDRAFARALVHDLPVGVAVIPGNHDVGFYDEPADVLEQRSATFRAAWGDDRFVHDIAGWRLVGVNAYLLGHADHDDWFRAAVAGDRPLLVFVHQPVFGDRDDEWQMSDRARAAFTAATAGADVRVVASGHRHCWRRDGQRVWAPSLTLTGDADDGCDPDAGFVEHRLSSDGATRRCVVRT